MSGEAELSREFIGARVLPHYSPPLDGPSTVVTALPGGLINRTFRTSRQTSRTSHADDTEFILQWVNPIFPAAIHRNIATVTAALRRAGVVTPELVPTTGGGLCLELGRAPEAKPPAVWRLMTAIRGVSFDVVASGAQAFAAGALVAAFHAALVDLDQRTFEGRRAGVHDTARHLTHLEDCLVRYPHHPLLVPVRALATTIQAAAFTLPPLPTLAPSIGHGDLKLNNFLFAGPDAPEAERAICLIDLDTVGPMSLAHEWGDAWRSWCNRSGEDAVEAELGLDVFAASWEGYRQHLGRELSRVERQALLVAPEWISLELAARFAADALHESYFGWDPSRFSTRGSHNLVRARGQWSLHQAFSRTRPERARLLSVALP